MRGPVDPHYVGQTVKRRNNNVSSAAYQVKHEVLHCDNKPQIRSLGIQLGAPCTGIHPGKENISEAYEIIRNIQFHSEENASSVLSVHRNQITLSGTASR